MNLTTDLEWEEYESPENEGPDGMWTRSRTVGGVLCRWWGPKDAQPPIGVKAIDSAAETVLLFLDIVTKSDEAYQALRNRLLGGGQ